MIIFESLQFYHPEQKIMPNQNGSGSKIAEIPTEVEEKLSILISRFE